MSRFKNSQSRPSSATRNGTVAATAIEPDPPSPTPGRLPFAGPPSQTGRLREAGIEAPSSRNVMRTIGFGALWVYVFSLAALVNETSADLFGLKPYVTTIGGPIMAVALLCSGNIFRGLRTKSGILWLAMICFMGASLPLSVWRSDSLSQWLQYAAKIYPLLFFIIAAAITVKQCERLLFAQIAACAIVIVLVSLLGYSQDGRLAMEVGSLYNPNTLALQVLLGGCCFVYLVYRGGFFWRVMGTVGIASAAIIVFRTGSRGAFLAIVVAIASLFFTIRQNSAKLKMASMIAILGICGLAAAVSNPEAFRRLTDITLSDQPTGTDALNAVASQMAREELLRLSVEMTLTHPLFGVGFGEFPVAVDNAARERGAKSTWNGTHNTYTQLSSECGIPAAICYIAVLLFSILTSRRLYREFSLYPGEEVIAGIALTLFAALVSLAVAIFFFHIAYTYYVPVFCGMALALHAVAKQRRVSGRRVSA